MTASLPESIPDHPPASRLGATARAERAARRKLIREFLLIFLPVATLIVAGAWLLGETRLQAELSMLMANEKTYIELSSARLAEELKVPVRHLASLVSEAPVRKVYQAADGTDLRPMQEAFISLLARNQSYDQVRWLDEHGMERVRVNNRNGIPQLVAQNQLQDKHTRYYFREAMQLEPGKIYISPLDLNMEQGSIEQPYNPTIRIATRVAGPLGQARGILIINISARPMLEAFVANAGPAANRLLLADDNGFLLRDIGANAEWGHMLLREVTAASRHPQAWLHIARQNEGQVTLADGVWTWLTVSPMTSTETALAQGMDWKVITRLPVSTISGLQREIWPVRIANALLILCLFGFGTARLVTARAAHARAEKEAELARSDAVAAQRLQEAQASFRLLFEANTNGLMVMDHAGRISMVNPAGARMFGYQPDELLRQPVEMLLPQEQRANHVHARAGYQRQATARSMGAGRDLRGMRKDGSQFPVEIGLSPYTDNGQNFVLATIVDITERMGAQDEIVKLNAQLQQSLDDLRQREKERDLWSRIIYSSLNEIYLFDAASWHFVFVNQGALTNLGYSMDELRSMTPLDLKPTLDRASFAELVAPLLSHAKHTITFETVHKRKDGTLYPVEVHLQTARQQDSTYFLAVIQDITERQRSAASMQTIIDSTDAMIWNTDVNGRVSFVSLRITEMLGYKPEDFLGRNLSEIFASDMFYELEGQLLAGSYRKLLASGQAVHRLDHRARHANGQWLWLSTSMTPVYDVAQKLIQIVGMTQDIDTQKTAEIALNNLNQTLELRVREEVQKNQAQERTLQEKDKLAAMGEMIGNIAHQWRQPINTLNILLMDLEDAYDHGEVDKRFLHETVQNCNSLVQGMSRTISDFMNFFRQDKEIRDFDLQESLQKCVELVQVAFQHNEIELESHCPDGILLNGVAGEFCHAILNLLANAKQAILARQVADGKVAISVSDLGDKVRIVITDNGGGIPDDILHKIFDAYFSTKAQGTGIGLYMTKMIIENTMHGSVTAKNSGHGACFTVAIPKATASLKKAEAHA